MNGKNNGCYDVGILLVWFGFSCPCRRMCHHNSKQRPSNLSPLSYNETFYPDGSAVFQDDPNPIHKVQRLTERFDEGENHMLWSS